MCFHVCVFMYSHLYVCLSHFVSFSLTYIYLHLPVCLPFSFFLFPSLCIYIYIYIYIWALICFLFKNHWTYLGNGNDHQNYFGSNGLAPVTDILLEGLMMFSIFGFVLKDLRTKNPNVLLIALKCYNTLATADGWFYLGSLMTSMKMDSDSWGCFSYWDLCLTIHYEESILYHFALSQQTAKTMVIKHSHKYTDYINDIFWKVACVRASVGNMKIYENTKFDKNKGRFSDWIKLGLVWHKARTLVLPVRIKLINNGLLSLACQVLYHVSCPLNFQSLAYFSSRSAV